MDSTVQICNNCGKAGQEVTSKCSRCKAAFYCGKECQLEDWKASHRRLCKQLNVSDAGQLRHPDHLNVQEKSDGLYAALSTSPLHIQKMFEMFLSEDTSDATYNKMKKLIMKEPMWARQMIMFQSLSILMQLPKKMALLRTSPLLISLDCGCDPNYISRPKPPFPRDDRGSTALHWLSEMADPDDYNSHQVQVILGQQLLDAGANVNAMTDIGLGNVTPLHRACHSAIVTNLSFIRLLLEHGADPNAKSVPQGETPLMHTMQCALPAAKLLLTFPSIVSVDVNARTANGSTFLGGIRGCVRKFQMMAMMASTDTELAKCKLLWKQAVQIEEILVEMRAEDGGWTDFRMFDDSDAYGGEFPPPNDVNSSFTDTVNVLLDKELLEDGPDWYKEMPFWVDDGLSIQLELFQKGSYLHTGFNKGTYNKTKKAAVGLQVQITVKLPSTIADRFGHLSGTVTEVCEEPTEEELRNSNSFMYGAICTCGSDRCSITADGTRESILEKYGALHGQEAMARVSLSKKDSRDPVYSKFFGGANDVFDVRLRCDDNKQNQWLLVHISKADGESS